MLKNTANLLNLQNLMKRDPGSYVDEFRQQQRHFAANLQIFHSSLAAAQAAASSSGVQASPASGAALATGVAGVSASSGAASLHGAQTGTGGVKSGRMSKDFAGLVTFLAHVAPCFRAEAQNYPAQLLELLGSHSAALDPQLRKTIVQAVILLQNRGMIDRMILLPVLFRLFGVPDKQLRLLLFTHIVGDIKRINQKKAPGFLKLNAQLQNYMTSMLSDASASPLAAKKGLDVMIDLWRRKIWHNDRTVHAALQACFSKDTKIKVAALRFFLGLSFYDEEEEEEEEEEKAELRAKMSVSKGALKGVVKASKRKRKEREFKRAQKKVNREDGKGGKGHSSVVDDCPAIQLIHDPQSFAERLFSALKRSAEAFSVRMLMMNVLSRLIGAHQLILLNFYPFLQKYMQPHQKNVTHILVYLAQASHPLVPPDVLQPVVKTLANHFVNDRSSPEVTAVGLNAIREICARAPLVMDADLLWDLVAYKKDKNKGVMMASRSIIALFRDINPNLLRRKERGKFASENPMDESEAEFGFQRVRTDIVGAELLEQINRARDEEGGEGKAMRLEDEWDLQLSEEESDEEEDEDLGTNAREVDAYLRHISKPEEEEDEEMDGSEKKSAGKKRAAAASDDEEDEEAADDEDGEEMEFEEMEDGEEAEDDEEDGEEEEDGEDADEEDAEQEEEEADGEDAPKAKKQKRQSTASNAEAQSEGMEEKKEADQPPKPALPIGATRIFTPRDFEELRQARLRAAMDGLNGKRKRESGTTLMKDHYAAGSDGEDDPNLVRQRERRNLVGTTVSTESIIGWRKKEHADKRERLASVLEGRAGGVNAKVKGGGSTNRDKEKAKPFKLTQHSAAVKAKKTHSFSQQQQTFSKHINKMRGMGKKIQRKMKRTKSAKAMGAR